VSTPRDDEALSWGGDDDPTLDVGENAVSERAVPLTSEPDPAPAGVAETSGPDPLQPAPEPPQTRSSPASPATRHPEAVDVASDDDEQGAAHSKPLGNAGLIGIGMVAATFLLFAVGWLVAGLRLQGLGLPIPSVTLIALTIGAALAPLVWFVAVLALTRSWRTWQRFLLLILGIVLLVPWPFLSLGAFA
jgi:hypothetical protein